MPQSFLAYQIKQDTRTAALLVIGAALFLWIVFNICFDAYPDVPASAYQSSISTSSEIGYPYRVQP